jgi:putative ABC transport system permease protein
MSTDATSSFILNEKAVNMMGIDDPIGKAFNYCGRKGTIIGVTNDANFLSLKEELDPRLYLIKSEGENFENVLVKLNNEPTDKKSSVSYTIGIIEDVWKDIYKDIPFEYQFVDQMYDRIYKADQQNNKVFAFFTILAITISCLGLLGLTLLSAQQRTKEISIRKVHGATLANILTMLNVSFIKLIVVAFIVCIPIAYYTSQKLLQNFAYHTNISWWIFLLAGITVVLIAIITVSYQSWSISKTNPVEKLKYE